MRKIAVLAVLWGMAMVAGCEKKPVVEVKISAADSGKKNPVGVNPVTIEAGRKLYHGSDCAICHGREGDGKGVLAKDISLNIHDWKDPQVQKRFTDGDLFFILDNGKDKMPGYSKEETEDQMWEIIAYIRSIGGPGRAAMNEEKKTQRAGM